MKKHVDRKELEILHRLMLQAQNRGGGFDLTFDEIAVAWDYKSKSACSMYLPMLVKAGLVISRKRGSRNIYRAMERKTK